MGLPYAILVSLCERSGSGYELAHRFNRSIGFFRSATHQQIYRTLRVMEGDGWVKATPVVQQDRPDKKVYTVSEAGRAELARWIAAPLTGRGSVLTDTRTRDIAVKLRGAAYGDVAALRTECPNPVVTVRDWIHHIVYAGRELVRDLGDGLRRNGIEPHIIGGGSPGGLAGYQGRDPAGHRAGGAAVVAAQRVGAVQ